HPRRLRFPAVAGGGGPGFAGGATDRAQPHRPGRLPRGSYSYLAMTRRSIYEFPEAPGAGQPSRLVIRPSDARYLFVYPFIKTRAWYMLPKAERQGMMDEHVRVGRQYPSIRLNTTYSYGLDDQEFSVAFEGEIPADFLDLVMELRESKASSYTLRDTPTFTCVQMSLWDMLDTL